MDIFIEYLLIICCVEKVALYVQYVNLIIWISLKIILNAIILLLKKKNVLMIVAMFVFSPLIIIFQIRIYVLKLMVNSITLMLLISKMIRLFEVHPNRKRYMREI